MKRTILAIAFCLVISEMFAQNIFTSTQKLNISETSLEWVNLSDRVIEDKENNKLVQVKGYLPKKTIRFILDSSKDRRN